mmetsp:Transcript_2902/g.12475  ORF Transcript_2902/g.12475 Transcript_2902/m.12475 type:complete len:211 (+) Transcript_2902:166-798(+)
MSASGLLPAPTPPPLTWAPRSFARSAAVDSSVSATSRRIFCSARDASGSSMSKLECSLTAIASLLDANPPVGTAFDTTKDTRSLKTSRNCWYRPIPAGPTPATAMPALSNPRYACLRQMFAARCSASRPAWTFSDRMPLTTSHARASRSRRRSASRCSPASRSCWSSAARPAAPRPSPPAAADAMSFATSGTTRSSSLWPRPICRMRHAP